MGQTGMLVNKKILPQKGVFFEKKIFTLNCLEFYGIDYFTKYF